MRLLVFGRTGQLARALARIAGPDAMFLGRDRADLADPAGCAAAIAAGRWDGVINAAAWTAVDKAETEEAAATRINAGSPGAMAQACALQGIPFLHVSTDYVFDGHGTRPWQPDDPPAPLNAYGRSKLAGEQAVQAAGGRAAILRTSWVFSADGSNFVRSMLRLGTDRPALRVVADQWGGPTPAAAIADTLLRMAGAMRDGAPGGIWHLAGRPDTTWAGFAEAIMAAARLPCRIDPIGTADYPTPARRPANSRLDCSTLTRDFGINPPDWRPALDQVVKELTT
jgi:dTDP-4-dehydrorhamnose reductase